MSTSESTRPAAGNVAKLPKWAQLELARLRARVEQLEARGQQYATTDTWVNTFDDATSVALPPHSRIVFYLDDGVEHTRAGDIAGPYFEARVHHPPRRAGDPAYLEVSTSSGVPAIVPVASNVVHVRHEGW